MPHGIEDAPPASSRPRRGFLLAGLVTAVLLIVLVAFGMLIFQAETSLGGALGSGRSISMYSRHSFGASGEFGRDTASLHWGMSHEVRVEPTQVLVDGHPVAPLLATAKQIDVHCDWNGVRVLADGVPVTTAPW